MKTHICLSLMALGLLLLPTTMAEAKFTEAKHSAWMEAPNSDYFAADQLLNRAWMQIRGIYANSPELATIKASQQDWVKSGRDASAARYSHLPEIDAYTMATFDRVNELNANLRPGFTEGDELSYQDANFSGTLTPEMGVNGFNLHILTANERSTCELTLRPAGPDVDGWQRHEVVVTDDGEDLNLEPVNVFISQDGVFLSQFLGLNPDSAKLPSQYYCGMVGRFEGLYITN